MSRRYGAPRWAGVLLLAGGALLAGCAASPPELDGLEPRLQRLLPTDVLLFGEQHDAPEHHRIEQWLVHTLASQGRLAAVAIEMAERGRSTANLPRHADEAQVRDVLAWNMAGWPWERYGPTVMEAVRAGIPVVGANLPRSAMRGAMAEAQWDTHLPAAALGTQRDSIRSGHCNLMPESQVGPMARIQIARDAAMAATAQEWLRPGQTVLVIAGGGHVLRGVGIPTHLPPAVRQAVVLAVAGAPESSRQAQADQTWTTPALPPQDYCAGLRKAAEAPTQPAAAP